MTISTPDSGFGVGNYAESRVVCVLPAKYKGANLTQAVEINPWSQQSRIFSASFVE